MDILLYPDPRLRAKNAPVTSFDATLEQITRDMFEAMYRTGGVGLAAPQVGVNLRLLVYNAAGKAAEKEQEHVLCNPKLVFKSREQEPGEEGCLSFPDIRGQVTRPIRVKVTAQNLQGEPMELELEDWDARIFLHEFDHLEGILFIDRMSPVSKSQAKGQLQDMVEHYRETQDAS